MASCARFILAGTLMFLAQETVSAQKTQKKLDLKDKVVNIDGFKSEAPKDWIRQKPSNLLRSYQFALPRAEGDKEDAEMGILPGISGSDEANIARWTRMFRPPEGKTYKDIATVQKMKVAGGKVLVTVLDVSGTYLKKNRPLDPDFKARPMPGYRMFAIIFETPDDVTLIRVIGPAKTMAHHQKNLMAWLKAFK
ncbi:MAG: hypothetical protein KatS3mg105_1971 [Gemmatales bacterium]|nr:MAG: hypothetical protein KatS3mg105_1971 [Gemmatales bacterium]